MLTVRTWQDAIGGGLLCIGCVEQRLGRELVPDDFSHALINEFAASQSERLRRDSPAKYSFIRIICRALARCALSLDA